MTVLVGTCSAPSLPGAETWLRFERESEAGSTARPNERDVLNMALGAGLLPNWFASEQGEALSGTPVASSRARDLSLVLRPSGRREAQLRSGRSVVGQAL